LRQIKEKRTMGETRNSEIEENRSLEEPRVGVYICHCGGNISDVVNVSKVAEEAFKLPNVVVARMHTFMCSDPGQAMILKDIQEEGLNRIVVASCSPKLHEMTFRGALKRAGLNDFLYEHANIREQVSWVHHAWPEEATQKAIRLVAAAVAKARRLKALEPIRVSAHKHALVVGGGVSGLKAALELSRRGIRVTLVERELLLGGQVAQLDRVYSTGEQARELILQLLGAVIRNPGIQILTGAEVQEAAGSIGNFHVVIRRHGIMAETNGGPPPRVSYRPFEGCRLEAEGPPVSTVELTVGSIVVATGFRPYNPRQNEFGYGENIPVITLPRLIQMLSPAGPTGGQLVWNGHPVKCVALIHCVGSRQVPGVHEPGPDGHLNEYCSRVCCTAALQAANEIRERFPETHVYDFYRDIRTYGRGHEEYYERASKRGVLFFRYDAQHPPVVSATSSGSNHPLSVHVKDTLTWNEEVETGVDLVVLAVGMEARGPDGLAEQLKIPVGSDRFLLEVHPKLRPVEASVEGVLLAGTSQGPKDITESCASASAAAAKAAAILSRGYVELEPFVAEVDPALCDGCGDCLGECGYEGALELVERKAEDGPTKRAFVHPVLCHGCGACAAVCPRRAISVAGWTLDQYDAMVDALMGQADVGGVE
jgi:heterodisulfide reductase subunit A